MRTIECKFNQQKEHRFFEMELDRQQRAGEEQKNKIIYLRLSITVTTIFILAVSRQEK